jgi:hypothetical protein
MQNEIKIQVRGKEGVQLRSVNPLHGYEECPSMPLVCFIAI